MTAPKFKVAALAFTMIAIANAPAFAAIGSTTAGASSGPLPTTIPSVSLAGTVSTSVTSPYASLQEAWDSCFSIRTTCNDLLDEGRFAPARKNWVSYDVSTIAQAVSTLKAAYDATNLPSDVAAGVSADWTAIGTNIDSLQKNSAELQGTSDKLKAPTDDKYPPAFWAPTRKIMTNADDIDKALIQVLGRMETAPSPVARGPNVLQGSITAKSRDVEGLMSASKKITDATMHLCAELDRFNLSWAKAPTTPLSDEFYQGAFTKQEILSQYKYMPSFVFTTDPSVAMFTYRLPPRKNMLALYSQQIGKLLNIMDTEMQNIKASVSASGNQSVTAPWQAMELKYIDARQQYMTLYTLLNVTTDDKLAQNIRDDQTTFGKPVIALRDDMDQFRDAMNDFVGVTK